MSSITLPAYAKVNLFLDVLVKRSDGYHELVTLFERVDWADELTVRSTSSSGVVLECDSREVPLDGTNLAVRAAEAFRRLSGRSDGITIRLRKRIPVGGGLGGGSSNAAAVLLALQRLSGGVLPQKEMVSCARELGADVAFFLEEVPFGLGRGRGDEVEPISLSARWWHLLVTPDFPIPTKAVYGAFRLTAPPRDPGAFLTALKKGEVSSLRDLLYNALEPAVGALYPAIRRVKQEMEAAGLKKPMVSGSGSAVFALCDSEAQARSAGEALREKHPCWRVHAVSTI